MSEHESWRREFVTANNLLLVLRTRRSTGQQVRESEINRAKARVREARRKLRELVERG